MAVAATRAPARQLHRCLFHPHHQRGHDDSFPLPIWDQNCSRRRTSPIYRRLRRRKSTRLGLARHHQYTFNNHVDGIEFVYATTAGSQQSSNRSCTQERTVAGYWDPQYPQFSLRRASSEADLDAACFVISPAPFSVQTPDVKVIVLYLTNASDTIRQFIILYPPGKSRCGLAHLSSLTTAHVTRVPRTSFYNKEATGKCTQCLNRLLKPRIRV